MTDVPSDSDNLIPAEALVKRSGRPYRAMGRDALRPLEHPRAVTPTCSRCEKWDGRGSWCVVRACIVQGSGPMCRYGIVLYRARRLRERRRNGKQ